MKSVILLAILTSYATLKTASAATDKIVCYHGTWSAYRLGNGQFTSEDIDPNLCTHLIYSFVGLTDDGTITNLDSWLDLNLDNFKRFNALKQKNKNLKTLLAIGGWNQGSVRYSNAVATAAKRTKFVKDALNLVQTWGFDGFDLDWEYPAQRGGAAADKQNFVSLIKELRQEFDKYGLLLTAAVAATGESVDLSYDVPSLSKYLDFINVMAYDLHGSTDKVTGQNAPLYASSIDVTQNQKLLNVDAAIRGWIQRGASPQKLVMGLGAYGRTFTLANPSGNKLGAPAVGSGDPGPYTEEPGMLGYNEIVELQKSGGWTVVWDDEQKVPYMYKNQQWVGYDDTRSVGIKVEYAKSLNLGGVMLWSIETEDFNGLSGTKFPLLNAVHQSLGDITNENAEPAPEPGPEPVPEPVPEPDPKPVPEPKPEPTPQPSTDQVCKKEGYVRDPSDCSTYYYCMPNNGVFIPLQLKCGANLVFDEKRITCDYPQLVQC